MAHTGIFATSDEILVKAGADYDTAITEARINALCLQFESIANNVTRYNWSDNWAALNADVQGTLASAESAWVGWKIVQFNLASYPTLAHAQTMLNGLSAEWDEAKAMIKDINITKFTQGA